MLEKTVQQHAGRAHGNRRVRHVEGGEILLPVMHGNEIHHVAQGHPVPEIADRAAEDLNAEQRAFLIISMTEDQTGAEAARTDLSLSDAMEVAGFMTSAPAACASEDGG